MILSGEKKEEYRDIKPYWVRRLVHIRDEMEWDIWEGFCGDLSNPFLRYYSVEELMDSYGAGFSRFDYVEFTNGYGNHRPRFTTKFHGIEIGVGNHAWGAPDVPVFKILLGDIVSKENLA